MIGIYKITSPNGKIYIGQSINIEKRIIRYRNLHCKSQPKIYNSIRKYGWNKHLFEILLECEINELNDKERYFQDLFNAIENGMNCTLTMQNSKSGTQSKSTIEKRRIGELNYLSKIILNTETGIFYFGLNEASKSIGMKIATLHINIMKNKINKTPFIYV